jgi:hypothetical protein
MQFSVETWAPEYGVAADGAQLEESNLAIDATVERALDNWAPITPVASSAQRVLFVDGVRRIEARVWITADGFTRVGVCASVAAGSVLCIPGSAVVHEVQVSRGLYAKPASTTEPIDTPYGVYEFFPVPGDSPEELYLGVHNQMTAVESEIAAKHDCELVVFDGPLRGRHDPLAVGYVKTQHVQYLPPQVYPILGQLAPGQRTPIFVMGAGKSSRYSWYLRLPGPLSQPLAGIVRCEMNGIGSPAAAIERADVISATLPRYASEAHKDPRAPQNLYPIAGLEQQLKHRLGDAQLLERGLRRAADNAGAVHNA